MEDKKKRKEARELARKQAGLKAMKEEMHAKFVAKAEHKDQFMQLEMMEINANHQKQGVQGVIGGFIGQMVMVFNGAYQAALKHKIDDFLTPSVVQNFIFNYIDSKMRTDKFTLMVGKPVEHFLNTLEKPL